MTTAAGAPSLTADALSERLFTAALDALELYHVYLGDRLGLYRALDAHGASTAAELAAATSLSVRYVREWLEQQAVAGILQVEEPTQDPDTRRFQLPAELTPVLLDDESLLNLVPLAAGVVGCARLLPEVLDAFASGRGIPYSQYGEDIRGCVARVNRPMFVNQLGQLWFPAIADLHTRLTAEPPARVADIGCGTGWSSVAIATAYPRATVQGFDLDHASIGEAAEHAAQAGVADRVAFTAADAASASDTEPYDLVCAFETVHDMADPTRVLRTMRTLAGERGVVLVADEKVAETFTAPGDVLERFNYGWSALHCLPVGMTQENSAGTGTVMRPEILRRYALDAGFSHVEVLPIEHDFWRFYRLHR